MNIREIDFSSELKFLTSRSGGKGGQNVNKVSTKVELLFNIDSSAIINDNQKELLYQKLKNKISKDGVLHVVSSSERTQLANKRIVVKKFYNLLENSFKVRKPRKPSNPSRSSKERRLGIKKYQSKKKVLRNKNIPDFD